MKKKQKGVLVGVLIILAGILLLLGNLNVLEMEEDFVVGAIFLAAGGALFRVHHGDSRKWWALIVGGILCFIGVVIIIEASRVIPDDVNWAVFLWGVAAIFGAVYWSKRETWWILIPGGMFFVLGLIVLLNAFRLVREETLWFVFFLGLGLTFGFLYLIRDEKNKLNWAQYPSVALILLSFFILSSVSRSLIPDLIFPGLLIFLGGYLVYNSLRLGEKTEGEKKEVLKQG